MIKIEWLIRLINCGSICCYMIMRAEEKEFKYCYSVVLLIELEVVGGEGKNAPNQN